jgi:thiol:disulfide interchange protein DsbG
MRTHLLMIAAILASTIALAEPKVSQAGAENDTGGAPVSDAPKAVTGVTFGASELSRIAPELIEQTPALQHLARSGARLFDAGGAHGMRAIVARQGDEFMILQLTPDGEAIVSGVQTDLSADLLLTIVGHGEPQVTELGTSHGMRGLFVRNGRQFQVFYVTPDGERMIPGVMWDASGKNITREQVAPLSGVTPTVTIGREKFTGGAGIGSQEKVASALEAAHSASFGTIGPEAAPRIYVFIDPLCGYSVRALQQLQPFVAGGRVLVAIIPVSVLDYENDGRSTKSALAMMSKAADQMATAWSRGDLNGPASQEAEELLRRNMAIAEAIGLRGTPTVIWRKKDGSEGRVDGLPEDWNAVIASIGSESHAGR